MSQSNENRPKNFPTLQMVDVIGSNDIDSFLFLFLHAVFVFYNMHRKKYISHFWICYDILFCICLFLPLFFVALRFVSFHYVFYR